MCLSLVLCCFMSTAIISMSTVIVNTDMTTTITVTIASINGVGVVLLFSGIAALLLVLWSLMVAVDST